MAENSSALAISQVGLETTPGTSVAGSKFLNYLGWSPNPQMNTAVFRPQGSLVATGVALTQSYTDWSLAADVCSYVEMPYIFNSLLKQITPTTVDTTGKEWLWEPSRSAEETISTYTLENGNSVRAGKSVYTFIHGAEFTFNRETGLSMSGAATGQNWQDNITLTAGPTSAQDKPIPATQLSVFIDSTSAGLGGTRITRDFNAVFRCNDRTAPIWTIDDTKPSFAAHVVSVPTIEMELTFEYDTVGAANSFTTISAGTTKFIRCQALSTDLAGSATRMYDFRIDMAGKCTGVSMDETDNIRTVTATFTAVFDSTWGKFLSVRNTNQLASL